MGLHMQTIHFLLVRWEGALLAGVEQFCDSSGAQRTNEWAFDVLNVESASQVVVPVPAAIWLFGSGLFCLIGFARRQA